MLCGISLMASAFSGVFTLNIYISDFIGEINYFRHTGGTWTRTDNFIDGCIVKQKYTCFLEGHPIQIYRFTYPAHQVMNGYPKTVSLLFLFLLIPSLLPARFLRQLSFWE